MAKQRLDNNTHEMYESARRRVRQKRKVYIHFIVFLTGSFTAFIINDIINIGKRLYGTWYPIFILVWLFFILLHFIDVFITQPFFGKNWERAETDKLLKEHDEKVEKLKEKLNLDQRDYNDKNID